jgi:hypothetical protein
MAPQAILSVLSILIELVMIVLYFLPTMIAYIRGRHNKITIMVLNLCIGWSVIGWIVSLVWALGPNQRPLIAMQASKR